MLLLIYKCQKEGHAYVPSISGDEILLGIELHVRSIDSANCTVILMIIIARIMPLNYGSTLSGIM